MPAAADIAESKPGGAWLTIGAFDGVHRGHQAIINQLVEGAHQASAPALVVTFFPHPAKVLGGIEGPFYLSTPEEKERYMAGLGVFSLLTLEFTRSLSRLSAYDFMKLLHDRLRFQCLLIGYDFHLGRDREGDFQRLSEIGAELGYCVRPVEPLQADEEPISSSRIRHLLSTGALDEANHLLGRWYEAGGKIVHGDGRGRHIGLPTANIAIWPEKMLPQTGIYATWSKIGERFVPGVVNIGSRPTFYAQPVEETIEVHLLDFDEDIYGQTLRLFFVKRIRDEEKFDSVEALMEQIRMDIAISREVLAHAPTEKNLSA